MKLAIAGSRDVPEAVALDLLRGELRLLGWDALDHVDAVGHGAGKGVDAAADELAALETVAVHRFPADWHRHGDSAGPIRNTALASWLAASPAGALLALWDPRPRRRGQSTGRRGTADVAEKAARLGCRVVLCVLEVTRKTSKMPRLYRVVERVDSAVAGAQAVLDRLDAAAAVPA